ncbi:conserved hypothetical protein [Tenacibaculum litopenaei]|uniref:helix-turn-helix domain-containing protein n=1 Tax=Tenacibaculum litopenaei TaxID=396016 RepID=UPI0038966941
MKTFILIDEDSFFELIDKVVAHIDQKATEKNSKWITPEAAMKALNITSKTTLQRYRDEGKIRFAQPSKKIILYDSQSIDEFLEKNTRDTF